MNESKQPELLTGISQLMKFTGCDQSTCTEWCDRSNEPLPFTVGSGGVKVFEAVQVEAWLRDHGWAPVEEHEERYSDLMKKMRATTLNFVEKIHAKYPAKEGAKGVEESKREFNEFFDLLEASES